ncbi:MAG: PAS domain-containing sensor histidine kinase [Candidatus Neomarinimicrobiota bacterium]
MNKPVNQKQLLDIIGVIQKIASGSFSARAPINNVDDNLDAIAMGINMLGEEIEMQQGELKTQLNEISELAEGLRAANNEIKESESKYRTLAENINVGIYRSDVQDPGTFIEVNPAFLKIFGFSNKTECLKTKVIDLYISSEERKIFISQLLKEGSVRNKILRLKKKDGSEFFGSVSAVSVKHTNDTIEFVDGIIEDVSEREALLKVIYESEEKYRDLFNNAPDMIVSVDARTSKIRDCNQTIVDNLGFSKKEIIGRSIVDMYHADSREGGRRAFNKFAKTGEVRDAELQLKRKDGSKIDVSLNISAIRDEEGTILYSKSVWRDITKSKALEEKLLRSEANYRTLSENLEESNLLKELLIDVITHDLKNTAGTIHGLSGLLNSEKPDVEIVRSLRHSSGKMLDVLENATILSKINVGDAIKKCEMNLTEELKDMSKEFKSQLKMVNMELVLKIEPDLIVNANTIINEVFKNYISNAIKYARDGKKIILEGKKEKDTIVINIRDLGKTIPEEKRELIFRRKVQLTKKKRRGQGLGLAIVKRIAEAHDAEAGVIPNTPTGNNFYLRIPAYKN